MGHVKKPSCVGQWCVCVCLKGQCPRLRCTRSATIGDQACHEGGGHPRWLGRCDAACGTNQLPVVWPFPPRRYGCGSKNRYQDGTLVSGNMDQNLHNPSSLILSHAHMHPKLARGMDCGPKSALLRCSRMHPTPFYRSSSFGLVFLKDLWGALWAVVPDTPQIPGGSLHDRLHFSPLVFFLQQPPLFPRFRGVIKVRWGCFPLAHLLGDFDGKIARPVFRGVSVPGRPKLGDLGSQLG